MLYIVLALKSFMHSVDGVSQIKKRSEGKAAEGTM